MRNASKILIPLTVAIFAVVLFLPERAQAGFPDLSWATSSPGGFTIWPADSGVLTWNDNTDGNVLCTANLTDTNGDTTNCTSGEIQASTKYRVQVELLNIDGSLK